MAASPYEQLEQEFRRLHAFRGALSLLRWDAAVMMPRGSADVRGEQLAALETEHHALLTTPKVARLLERAEAGASQLEDWPLANLREMRRQRDHAIATPPSLIARLAKATARAEVFWVEAQEGQRLQVVRAAPGGGRASGARQGGAARSGARPRALRRAGGRIHAGHFDRGHRHHLQGAVAQASRPHQSGHRGAGRACARCRWRASSRVARQRSLSRRSAQGAGVSLRSRPAR